MTLTVATVNDAPSFNVPATHSVDGSTGPQTVPGFATDISTGPPDESGQTLTFHVTVDTHPDLFLVPPALTADGTLTYTAAADAQGTSTVIVALMDDGGTANGGQDTSAPQSVDIGIFIFNDGFESGDLAGWSATLP